MTKHKRVLTGRNIIVTGASRGLGLDITRAMWGAGANLLLVARTKDQLLDLRTELVANAIIQQQVDIAVADLSRPDFVQGIMDKAHSMWDGIDLLVNNAGILGPIGPIWTNDWEEWQTTIRVNLLAPVELCRACVPIMLERGRGKIINLSGGGATGPRPNFTAYAVAKAGLVRFSESLAQGVRDKNIQVNCVAPGAMNTEMLQTVLRAGPERAGATEYAQARRQVDEGGASPQRAADLCVFLASSASDGITGKLISAVWDPWESLSEHKDDLDSDIYTLRRIVPKDRGKDWG